MKTNLDYNYSKNLTYNIVKHVFGSIWTDEESLFFSRYLEKISNNIYNAFKTKIIGLDRGDLKLCLYNALIKGKENYNNIKYIKAYISVIFKNNCLNSIKKDVNNHNNYNQFVKHYNEKFHYNVQIDEEEMVRKSFALQLIENQNDFNKNILRRMAFGYTWNQIAELDDVNSWNIRKCIKIASNYDKV